MAEVFSVPICFFCLAPNYFFFSAITLRMDGIQLWICCMDLKGLHTICTWSSLQLWDITFPLKLL